MPLGVLSGAGLGVVSTIPGECWDQAGFKECHASMYRTAKIECVAQGKDNDACIVPKTDLYAKAACKCVKKPKAPTTYSPPSSTPSSEFEPTTTFLGMSSNTLFLIAAAAGAYYLLTDKKKPAKKG